MTYLTLMELDPRRNDVRSDIANAGQLHKTIMSMFPHTNKSSARNHFGVLWNRETIRPPAQADSGENTTITGPQILVQSGHQPNPRSLPKGYTMSLKTKQIDVFLNSIADGECLRYRAVVSPVRHTKSEGKAGRVLVPMSERSQWWSDKLPTLGAEALDRPSTISRPKIEIKRDDKRFGYVATSFEGHLSVSDADKLREYLHSGFGRGKSYGCGLITVARI